MFQTITPSLRPTANPPPPAGRPKFASSGCRSNTRAGRPSIQRTPSPRSSSSPARGPPPRPRVAPPAPRHSSCSAVWTRPAGASLRRSGPATAASSRAEGTTPAQPRPVSLGVRRVPRHPISTRDLRVVRARRVHHPRPTPKTSRHTPAHEATAQVRRTSHHTRIEAARPFAMSSGPRRLEILTDARYESSPS